jgi:AcrR family transcriptional regulator
MAGSKSVQVDRPAGDAAAATARPRRRTQRERVETTERRLIAATMNLLARHGFNGTSVASIAAAAGYSSGLIHHRFGSKLALLEQVLADSHRHGQAELRRHAPENEPAIATLLRHCRTRLEYGGTRRRSYYAIIGESLGAVPEVRPIIAASSARNRALFEGLIRAAQADGDANPEVDAAVWAALLMALIRGTHVEALLDPANAGGTSMRKTIEDVLLDTIATAKGRRVVAAAEKAAAKKAPAGKASARKSPAKQAADR